MGADIGISLTRSSTSPTYDPFMSERFRQLIAEWKVANARATEAQTALNDAFQRFIDGRGDEPTEAERSQVEKLRKIADAQLEVALGYVRDTARGPSSRK